MNGFVLLEMSEKRRNFCQLFHVILRHEAAEKNPSGKKYAYTGPHNEQK
jgi:hypothetical protein